MSLPGGVSKSELEVRLRRIQADVRRLLAEAEGRVSRQVSVQVSSVALDKVSWADINSKPTTFPPETHDHDDLYYTQAQIDAFLGALDYYTQAEVDALFAALDFYETGEVDTLLAGKSDTGHIHDDLYYTEAETDALFAALDYYTQGAVDALLDDKSDTGHTHEIGDVDDLQTSLDRYPVVNVTAYRYYRLNITDAIDPTLTFGTVKVELRGTVSGTDLTQTEGGTASASDAHASNPAANAFDNDSSTRFANNSNPTFPVTLQWDFGADNAQLVREYVVAAYRDANSADNPNNSLYSWQFQASNNGTDWETLHTVLEETWPTLYEEREWDSGLSAGLGLTIPDLVANDGDTLIYDLALDAWYPAEPTGGAGATGGGDDEAFFENDIQITTDYTITTGKNAMSAGPVEIEDGVTITVPDGSVWTVL